MTNELSRTSIKPNMFPIFQTALVGELGLIEPHDTAERIEILQTAMAIGAALTNRETPLSYNDIETIFADNREQRQKLLEGVSGEDFAKNIDIVNTLEAKIRTVYERYARLGEELDRSGEEPRR